MRNAKVVAGSSRGPGASLSAVQPAPAQSWPQRPVKIIVPFPLAETRRHRPHHAQRLGEAFGQQFVVENVPGQRHCLRPRRSPARGDGHMLLMGRRPDRHRSGDDQDAVRSIRDFAPISVIGTNPLVLVVHPSIPARTVAEFITYVRAQPVKLTYASAASAASFICRRRCSCIAQVSR